MKTVTVRKVRFIISLLIHFLGHHLMELQMKKYYLKSKRSPPKRMNLSWIHCAGCTFIKKKGIYL